jgi:hypothetical protein
MNADYAVRTDGHIDVTETRPQRVKGTGRYRHWLPSAILRCCWGLRPRPRSRCKTRTRCTTKQPPPTKPSPLVASARCIASFYRAGHNYVQIRNAVAQRRRVFFPRWRKSQDSAQSPCVCIAASLLDKGVPTQAAILRWFERSQCPGGSRYIFKLI